MKRVKSIVSGIIISVMLWFCIYVIVSMIDYRFGLHDLRQPNRSPESLPPGVTAGDVRVHRIEELSDLYLKSLARTAVIRFDKNEIEEWFKIVNMSINNNDRDDILMAIIDDLLRSSTYVGLRNRETLLERPPARPPLTATPTQRLEYEKKVEESKKKTDENRRVRAEESRKARNRKIANIEAIAEKIGDPLKRAAALSQIAVHWVSPMMRDSGSSEQKAFELEEREAAATKDGSAAIESLKIEREKRMQKQRGISAIPYFYFWIGTVMFAILGPIIVIFGNPVIEALGKAIGEAMVKEFDSMKSYQQHKEAGLNA